MTASWRVEIERVPQKENTRIRDAACTTRPERAQKQTKSFVLYSPLSERRACSRFKDEVCDDVRAPDVATPQSRNLAVFISCRHPATLAPSNPPTSQPLLPSPLRIIAISRLSDLAQHRNIATHHKLRCCQQLTTLALSQRDHLLLKDKGRQRLATDVTTSVKRRGKKKGGPRTALMRRTTTEHETPGPDTAVCVLMRGLRARGV